MQQTSSTSSSTSSSSTSGSTSSSTSGSTSGSIQIPSADKPRGLKYFTKELTQCNKLCFSNPYIFGFQRRKPLKYQTMTFVRSKNISFKYQRFTTLGSKDIGIRKSEFVGKSQFLLQKKF